MKKMYLFWAILTLIVFSVAVILAGVGFSVFLRVPSLLIVILPPLFLALAVFPSNEIWGYFRAASARATPSQEQLGRNAATALLAHYSLVLNALVIVPFRSAIAKKLASVPE